MFFDDTIQAHNKFGGIETCFVQTAVLKILTDQNSAQAAEKICLRKQSLVRRQN
jgi:hypothetical protein